MDRTFRLFLEGDLSQLSIAGTNFHPLTVCNNICNVSFLRLSVVFIDYGFRCSKNVNTAFRRCRMRLSKGCKS